MVEGGAFRLPIVVKCGDVEVDFEAVDLSAECIAFDRNIHHRAAADPSQYLLP